MRVSSMDGKQGSMATALLLCALCLIAGLPSALALAQPENWDWFPGHGDPWSPPSNGGEPPLFPAPEYPPGGGDGGSPPYDGGSPPYDGGSPPYDGGSPPYDGGSPPYDGGSPPYDGGSPPYDGGSPPYDGGSPPYDGGSPPYDGGSPPYGGGSPPYDGGSPPYDGGSPPYDGGSPPYDGGSPPYDGGSPPYDGGSPPYDGGSPPYDGGSPPYDGGSPPYDGGSPPYDGGSPPYDGGSPYGAPPYDGGSPPYDGGSPPYDGGIPPSYPPTTSPGDEPIPWFSGCGASYWASTAEKWPANYKESTTIPDVFGEESSNHYDQVSLMDALLTTNTDGYSALSKHGVAALFNSHKAGYQYTTSEVKTMFNGALSSEDSANVQAVKFENANTGYNN